MDAAVNSCLPRGMNGVQGIEANTLNVDGSDYSSA